MFQFFLLYCKNETIYETITLIKLETLQVFILVKLNLIA